MAACVGVVAGYEDGVMICGVLGDGRCGIAGVLPT
jgi:hypothetical protein